MILDSAVKYEARFNNLVKVAVKLEQLIVEYLDATPNIDRISCRAKDPARFAEKAGRLNSCGQLRYQDPTTQIQDQIGARVIVLYPEGVNAVLAELDEWFKPVEETVHEPVSPSAFGYFGEHRIYPLPNLIVPEDVDTTELPRFFELQVKTGFQHAWSEAEHDLRYKSNTTLTDEQNRQFALAAALAWEADQVFARLVNELSKMEGYRNPLLSYYSSSDFHARAQIPPT